MAPEIIRLINRTGVDPDIFTKRFFVDKKDEYGVFIFQVVYMNTEYAKPPLHNEVRRLRPDCSWLSVKNQLLVPLPDYPDAYPLQYKTIYESD